MIERSSGTEAKCSLFSFYPLTDSQRFEMWKSGKKHVKYNKESKLVSFSSVLLLSNFLVRKVDLSSKIPSRIKRVIRSTSSNVILMGLSSNQGSKPRNYLPRRKCYLSCYYCTSSFSDPTAVRSITSNTFLPESITSIRPTDLLTSFLSLSLKITYLTNS